MARPHNERTRIQGDLYPWIVLSVLDSKVGKPGWLTPTDPVWFGQRVTNRRVEWKPGERRVRFTTDPEGGEKPDGIGIRFPDADGAVRFFENNRLNPLHLVRPYRLRQWKRLSASLLRVQGEMSVRNWQKCSRQKLFEKTMTTLFSAVVGLNGLAQVDAFSRSLIHHLPEGTLGISIGGLSGTVAKVGISKGELQWLTPTDSSPGRSVDFAFRDVETAWKCVANLSDNLAAVGKGDIHLRGYIPLADGFNHLLDRLQMFVKVD